LAVYRIIARWAGPFAATNGGPKGSPAPAEIFATGERIFSEEFDRGRRKRVMDKTIERIAGLRGPFLGGSSTLRSMCCICQAKMPPLANRKCTHFEKSSRALLIENAPFC
jgi:hypothetical protein